MTPDKSINEKSYNLALKYLRHRPRSRAEIRDYLNAKSFSGKIVLQTIQQLEEDGWIDDVKFAMLWVESRRRLKPKGAFALKIELRKKGINDEIIDLALKDDDEEKNARTALESRILRWGHLDKAERKKKIFGFLRSRGFSFEVSAELCARFIDDVATTHDIYG
jgi:regulatory protein